MGVACLPCCSLRVSVAYNDPFSGTIKELPKFYKFAVTDPVKFNYRTVFLQARVVTGWGVCG